MQISCIHCRKYNGYSKLDTCGPVDHENLRSNSKCNNCRFRSVKCEWGYLIPREMNGIKIRCHESQTQASKGGSSKTANQSHTEGRRSESDDSQGSEELLRETQRAIRDLCAQRERDWRDVVNFLAGST
jgi:hypothetical protein